MTTDQNLPLVKPMERLKRIINSDSVKQQFQNAMGKHSDLFVASIIDIVSGDTKLQNCEPALVVSECLKAATLKLPINKSLGFAYIIPYNKSYKEGNVWKKKVIPQFQMGYKGFIQLAMRTSKYKYINAGPVYKGELVSTDKLTGAIDLSGTKEDDTVIGYFAHIETVNGFKKTAYGSLDDVKKHGEKYSPGYSHDKSLWKTDLDSMGVKTMIKMLLGKYGIMSVEMAGTMSRAFEYDQETPESNLKREIENSDSEIIDIEGDNVLDIKDEDIGDAVTDEPEPEEPAPGNEGLPEKSF